MTPSKFTVPSEFENFGSFAQKFIILPVAETDETSNKSFGKDSTPDTALMTCPEVETITDTLTVSPILTLWEIGSMSKFAAKTFTEKNIAKKIIKNFMNFITA